MTPHQHLQKLLASIPGYGASDLIQLLPLAAALQSAIYARILILSHQAALPDTDYLFNARQIADRIGKSPKWVRDNVDQLPFALPLLGSEHRFSARRFDEWIDENLAATMGAALPPERRQREG